MRVGLGQFLPNPILESINFIQVEFTSQPAIFTSNSNKTDLITNMLDLWMVMGIFIGAESSHMLFTPLDKNYYYALFIFVRIKTDL